MWSDNKVHELVTVCFPLQHWTKKLIMVWLHWHISVSEICCCWSMAVPFWMASVTGCVFWGAAARMSELELEQRTNIKFLVVSW